MKPDIVFFGQSLPEEFHHQMQLDKDECDLLIVIGSSLKVQPVALIPSKHLLFLFGYKRGPEIPKHSIPKPHQLLPHLIQDWFYFLLLPSVL